MKKAEKKQILVDHYLDLFGNAMNLLGDVEDAKDAVQEALVVTMVKGGVEDPYKYCQWVLKNKCIDMLRYRKKVTQLETTNLATDPEKEELLQLVADKKTELKPEERKILEMHYEDGMKLSMVAKEMKRILIVAKDNLKRKIELER